MQAGSEEAATKSFDAISLEVAKNHRAREGERVLLKQCSLALISNLALDTTLRGWIASDMSGVLSSVVVLFKKDLKDKSFDWL